MKNEIVCKNIELGMKLAEMLLQEDYVVMLSREDNFLVINFLYADGADRNDVVLMRRDAFEEEFDEQYEDIINDVAKDFANGTLANRLAPRIAKWKKDISSI